MKLALGSAQFGLDYGVANNLGQVKPEEIREILNFAREFGIDTLDTAISYGRSESILGEIGISSWKVVSKLPDLPNKYIDLHKWVTAQAVKSIKNLGISQLYGFLIHHPSQLLGDRGEELYEALESLKKSNLIKKIGISIYKPSELELLFEFYKFDLVQAPVNILDRSLEESGWSQKLKRAGVEIHARSIFLQGLLLMPPAHRPAKFIHWKDILNEWDRWLISANITPLEACLQYVDTLHFVDKIIVGVDSIDQLKEIIKAKNGKTLSPPVFNSLLDDRLINPSTWNFL
jgi:aryl-alcohol dehydrogenase-like predicted oxidoreductase